MDETDGVIINLGSAIAACRICRDAPLTAPLPHEPRPVAILSSTARILIAGQAPGLRVHLSGLPFDDASGDRLRQWLGVERKQFYDRSNFAIIPMGFCFPGYDDKGSDLPPRRECAPHWRSRVLEAMPQIELILAIGQYAQRYHLEKTRGATVQATVENWRMGLDRPKLPVILPLPHPSWRNSGWLKKNPWFEADLLPELRRRVKQLIA